MHYRTVFDPEMPITGVKTFLQQINAANAAHVPFLRLTAPGHERASRGAGHGHGLNRQNAPNVCHTYQTVPSVASSTGPSPLK